VKVVALTENDVMVGLAKRYKCMYAALLFEKEAEMSVFWSAWSIAMEPETLRGSPAPARSLSSSTGGSAKLEWPLNKYNSPEPKSSFVAVPALMKIWPSLGVTKR